MAILKGPLMSLTARGQIGKALVFSGWKGIATARQHVIPANPKSAGQVTQRGFLADAVAAYHDAGLTATDKGGFNIAAGLAASVMSGFNFITREGIATLQDALILGIVRSFSVVSNTGGAVSLSYKCTSGEATSVSWGLSPRVQNAPEVADYTSDNAVQEIDIDNLPVGEYVYFRVVLTSATHVCVSGYYKVLIAE